ncbi:MAG: M15 family metallopeptidase [Cellulomonas sp.]|nr:M15 family metallopeptidase [Cellulomonas sp.]
MRADAASALAQLNTLYVAQFGADICVSSGYRTLQQQYAVKAQKGGLAAQPGKSNHGWGLAVDFCSSMTSGSRWDWLQANAATYGFENPDWAQPGGSGPYERWHWEYLKGVKADGEYYG